jgi:two-component system sensor histidine kinase TctE
MWPNWLLEADYSLRRRLITAIGVVFIAATVLLFFAAEQYGRRAADKAYDRLLAASALAIADQVYAVDGSIAVDLPYSSLEMLAFARRDRVFYRVVGPGGDTVTGYEDLPLPKSITAATATPRFFDARYGPDEVRFVVLGRLVSEPGVQGWAMVQVGQSRIERQDLARDIAISAMAPILVLMALALGFVWIGINVALRPLAQIERDLGGRASTDLRPLQMSVPREVRHLVVGINHFLERLRASFDHMQTFIGEAAHQIRTPLASLRAQVDLAVEESDPAVLRDLLAKAQHNAALTSRLTGQLLSHATVVHRADAVPFGAVDLRDVLREVMAQAEFAAADKNVEFAVEDDGGDAAAWGDRVALREALRNLIDNAIKYGPAQATVDISLGRTDDGRRLAVEVADRGPGIPAAEKERVFRRFERLSARSGDGCGLGLAIVKRVADSHGAVRLLDRPGGGLIVRLEIRTALEPVA